LLSNFSQARQPSTEGTRRGSEVAAPEAGCPCGWGDNDTG